MLWSMHNLQKWNRENLNKNINRTTSPTNNNLFHSTSKPVKVNFVKVKYLILLRLMLALKSLPQA
jgi:hypothetical protein